MSDKIKYYKEIAELENRITEIKKTKGCFYVGDKVYYCPFFISKDVNFKEQTIIDCVIDDSSVDFTICDDKSVGIVGLSQIFKYKNKAIESYNKNLTKILLVLVKEQLTSEKKRIAFRTSNEPINDIYIDGDVKTLIIDFIIDFGNTALTINKLFSELKA